MITDDGVGFDYSASDIKNHYSLDDVWTDSISSLDGTPSGDPTFGTEGAPATETITPSLTPTYYIGEEVGLSTSSTSSSFNNVYTQDISNDHTQVGSAQSSGWDVQKVGAKFGSGHSAVGETFNQVTV